MQQNWEHENWIFIDESHNNLIHTGDPDFQFFFKCLKNQGYHICEEHSFNKISPGIMDKIKILLIGVPQNSLFTRKEIQNIIHFVENGGSLLMLHRLGGDVLQRTNLNDLSTHFGIYFENTLIKSEMNQSMPIISKFYGFLDPLSADPNFRLKKIILPGACSLRVANYGKAICKTSIQVDLDIFHSSTNKWSAYHEKSSFPVAISANVGQGRVIGIGSADFLLDNHYFGLKSLDNKNFCHMLFQWLNQPISKEELNKWFISQIAKLKEKINNLQQSNANLQATVDKLELRIRLIEKNFYEDDSV